MVQCGFCPLERAGQLALWRAHLSSFCIIGLADIFVCCPRVIEVSEKLGKRDEPEAQGTLWEARDGAWPRRASRCNRTDAGATSRRLGSPLNEKGDLSQ